MAVHAVMVRIDYDDDYSKRYAQTVDVIHREGGGAGEVWEEPTSSYILKSNKSAAQLCHDIYMSAPLYESRDTVVVVSLSHKGPDSYGQRGAKYPNTLAALMNAR